MPGIEAYTGVLATGDPLVSPEEVLDAANEVVSASEELVAASTVLEGALLEAQNLGWPPLHIVGADALLDAGNACQVLKVWCSCGWECDGFRFEPRDGVAERAAVTAGAHAWRRHVRLSRRVHRASKKVVPS